MERKPLLASDNPIFVGDVLEVLQTLPDNSVHCCVTSPPYWGLRDYGIEGSIWDGDINCEHEWGDEQPEFHKGQVEQTKWKNASGAGKAGNMKSGKFCLKCGAWYGNLGLEPSPDLYVNHLVGIFREVKRVLRKDGTFWLNLGDSYAAQRSCSTPPAETLGGGKNGWMENGERVNRGRHDGYNPSRNAAAIGLKHKDLVGIPWRVAFALQADGWYLRQDIIWAKQNPMPESVRDRCTKAHEYLFLLTKSGRYYYDHEAVKEPNSENSGKWGKMVPTKTAKAQGKHGETSALTVNMTRDECVAKYYTNGRNRRSVWNIATQPYKGAHFATFPKALVLPCILAGTSEKGCCSVCGANWKRIIEKQQTGDTRWSKKGGLHRADAPGAKLSEKSCFRTGSWNLTSTIGWEPTCNCHGECEPCIVLDPFIGSGTTGIVALENGRNFVGIDLKDEYVDMAIKRITNLK